MPIPHQEMRRIIRRRIRGLDGTERIRALKDALEELPGYYQGPYGELRKWVQELIAEAETRKDVRHQESYFLARQGAAQIVLVGPPNAGKSSLLRALTGRQVAIGDYPFTTLRPVEGMVAFDGAQVQLVDLPGLIGGAADGKGGGRSVLAAVRMADAALLVIPLSVPGPGEAAEVEAELRREGIDIPLAIAASKADLADAADRLTKIRAAYPERPLASCSTATGEGLEDVRRLIWDLSGLIRVFCRPRGGTVSERAVVLPRGAVVGGLVEALRRDWMPRFRSAHVTGPSAKFPGQPAGIDHILADGDVVELILV